MARDYAAIYTSVWADPDWRSLTPRLQHGYWLLLTQPRLSACGVLDFIPHRFAGLAKGLSARHVSEIVEELASTGPRPWLVLDGDTAELLVRSFVRHDSLIKAERPAKAIAKDFESIVSPTVRQSILDELRRVRQERPKLTGWAGIADQSPRLMGLIDAPERPFLEAVS